jgi:hypothetical protein
MRPLIAEQLDYDLTSVAGLALVGHHLERLAPVFNTSDGLMCADYFNEEVRNSNAILPPIAKKNRVKTRTSLTFRIPSLCAQKASAYTDRWSV